MNKPTFYVIPHTHWEGAVFQTREGYLEMGLPHILKALRLLKTYPDYRFTLDQACYVQPFLERYPEEGEAFRRFVAEGRLAIAGGMDVMADDNMPGGESFIRQVLYGKRYFRDALGIEIPVGWLLDTFGHHAQLPQVLRLAGYDSFWFFRGVASWEVPSEFQWEGLDGTRISAFWLQQGYCNLFGSPHTLPEFTAFMRQRYEQLAPQSPGGDRVGIAAHDVGDPEAHLPALVEEFNRQPDAPFHLQFAVPADYEAAVASQEHTVVRGELNPIFQGIYSSRIELKQRTRELETLLTTGEALGAMLRLCGEGPDDAVLWHAWEPMLFNQAHDLMSGVMTDHVYEDTIRGYDFSKRIATDELNARLQAVIDRIDTQGDGIPVVVFNMLGWPRTDITVARVSFTDPGAIGVSLIGPDGQAAPCQLLNAVRFEDGTLLQADVAFVARDVPAMGYAVYRVLPLAEESAQTAEAQDTAVLENEFYRLEIDRTSGAISALTVKYGDWQALNGPANVVAMEADHGDLWEPYHPLDGGSRIAMTERHLPPEAGAGVFSTDQVDEPGTVTRGPVISEFTVTHPMSEAGRFSTTIRLYTGLRRIEIHTTILNNDANVRYRALFPTAIDDGINMQEIPFGAIERPDGIEFPAQNWIDWGNAERGIALLNRGLPGNNVADGTLMLSLLRSACIASYGYVGGYEPGMGSDTGLELGKTLAFEYALLPHAGDWRRAAVYRDGQAFNHPLIARIASIHTGTLPPRWGFLQISHDNVVVSSLRTSESGQTVLRVYEAAGQAVDEVTITIAGTLRQVEELNLMEEPLQSLGMDGGRFSFALRPFEIKTFGFDVQVEPG